MGQKAVQARRAALWSVAATVLAGCMSSGTDVSDEQISQFVRGKTTESEVIARLGPPTMTQRSADGDLTDTYQYNKMALKAQSFIPLIGGFISASDTKTRMVMFTYSRKGILTNWTSSGGESTLNNGLLNQK